MNIIETRSIGNVILNPKTPQRQLRIERYRIPYFQRGYRWESRHIEALLDDLESFIKSGEENYCLQPIVVCASTDEDGLDSWDVIDGQQRLITLHIIFQYLSKKVYELTFAKRGKSTEFLKNLSKETLSDENPDFHYMSTAWKTVDTWFRNKSDNDTALIEEFYYMVARKAMVIWYQVADLGDEDKIHIFNRLNIGKIPLTDAELIRALLLSKIKYGLTEREANMRQAEISAEWNMIEHELQKDELWYFLNNTTGDYSSRIEFIFNLIAGKESQNYSTYLRFEKSVKADSEGEAAAKAMKLWDETKKIFAKFKSWFRESRTYHYVGFLLTARYTVGQLIEKSNMTKPNFRNWLKDRIVEEFAQIDLREITYSQPAELEKVFLLFNILTMDQRQSGVNDRFPFNHYKTVKNNGGWSIEHIHAQQSEPMKEQKSIRTWLQETLNAIEHIAIIEVSENANNEESAGHKSEKKEVGAHYTNKIQDMLLADEIDPGAFNELKNDLIELFDSSSTHDLDNLALLSKRHNSALNNSIFPVKRNKIMEFERSGIYIPVCTRNVFLKFYSNSDTQPYYWSASDKASYFSTIKEMFDNFLIKSE